MLDVTDAALGCDSEVGVLRVVILHRPGAELQRLTPRNTDALLFDGVPWVARAQREHDAFAALLKSRGVEVLLLADLLTEALAHSGAARMHGISAAVTLVGWECRWRRNFRRICAISTPPRWRGY